jgi:hypothetical protein
MYIGFIIEYINSRYYNGKKHGHAKLETRKEAMTGGGSSFRDQLDNHYHLGHDHIPLRIMNITFLIK